MTLKQVPQKISSPIFVYLTSFGLVWLAISLAPKTTWGTNIAAAAALAATLTAFSLLLWRKGAFAWWKAALASLMVAEVMFALSFWSTPGRNKAIIVVAVVFFFDQWFDRMDIKWLIIFLTVLLGCLALVPFQIL